MAQGSLERWCVQRRLPPSNVLKDDTCAGKAIQTPAGSSGPQRVAIDCKLVPRSASRLVPHEPPPRLHVSFDVS